MCPISDNFNAQQPKGETPFSGLYLVRTFRHEHPYTTLSDLDEIDTAQGIMKKNYGHIDDNNMNMRHNVEPWLKEGAQRNNITIERNNPIYFAVISDIENYKKQLPDGYKAEAIAMDDVDLSGWTFTMDDSFISAPVEVKGGEFLPNTEEHDLHGKVLTSDDVAKFFTSQNTGYEQKAEVGHVKQFEAQMWTQIPNTVCNRECPAASFTMKPF